MMANRNLDLLLTEYEEKRRISEQNLDRKKEVIYQQFPRIEEIDSTKFEYIL